MKLSWAISCYWSKSQMFSWWWGGRDSLWNVGILPYSDAADLFKFLCI